MNQEKFGPARQFVSEIGSINVVVKELHQFWAKALGISWPQLMILTTVSQLGGDDGIPVNVVAKILHVFPAFVSKESKLLESKGLLHRSPSPSDGRVVRIALSEAARAHLAALSVRQDAIHDFIFAEFSEGELREFTARLATLKNRIEKASFKALLDFADLELRPPIAVDQPRR